MIEQSFSLIPIPAANVPEITITGTIARQNGILTLQYALAGNIADIFVPSPSTHPGRKDGLWQTTCFEFFLAARDQPGYWEFNISPSGDWNVYRMDAYRGIGFREETSIQRLPFDVRKTAATFTLDLAADLTDLLHLDQRVEVGVTAVIQTRDGSQTYWALNHPASQADFHRRESFTLALAGQTHLSPPSVPGS